MKMTQSLLYLLPARICLNPWRVATAGANAPRQLCHWMIPHHFTLYLCRFQSLGLNLASKILSAPSIFSYITVSHFISNSTSSVTNMGVVSQMHALYQPCMSIRYCRSYCIDIPVREEVPHMTLVDPATSMKFTRTHSTI